MDIATLGLAVDSREVVDASKDLDRIREAAAKAERQADNFGKRVEDAGKRAAAANDNAARAADRATKAYGGYSQAATLAARAMGAIAGAAVGSALIKYADAWSDMQSRVGAAIKDMDAAPALMQRIVDIANASYSPLDQTVEVYSRNVAVLRDLGRGATEAADFTEALNHALVVTATRGERAASVQNALSKAMAVGKLQADGLETVLANGGRVAEALAAELGTNVNGLRKFATQGKITGDVIASALIGNLEKLRAEAAEMPATIGDAFTRIQTNLTAFVGQLDKTVGASETVAGALLVLADNIGRVVTTAATAVTAFGTYYVAAMAAAYLSTITLSGALTFLRAALIRTGIGALIVGAGELVYQFGRLVSAAGGFGNAMGLLGDLASEVWERIKLDANSAYLGVQAVWERIKVGWLTALSVMQKAWADFLHKVAGAALTVPGMEDTALSIRHSAVLAGSAYYETEAAIASAREEVERLSAASEDAAEKARAPLESIAAIRKVLADAAAGGEIPNTPGVRAPPVAEVDKAAQKAAKAYDKIVIGARQYISEKEMESRALFMTEEAAARLRHEQDLLNKAQDAGIKLTPKQREQLKGLAGDMAAAEVANNRLKETFEFAKDLTKGFVSDLRSGLEQGKGFWKSFGDAALNVLDKIVDKLLNDVIDALFQVNSASSGAGSGGFLGSLLGGIGKLFGFAKGGYTGPGAASQPAGIVHAGEYVFSKKAVDRIGVGHLDRAHKAAKGYMSGGYVRAYAPANSNLRGYDVGGYVAPAPQYDGNAAVAQGREVIEVVLRDDSGRMAEIADQQIQTRSGAIVQVSVQQSVKSVRSQMPGMIADAQTRKL